MLMSGTNQLPIAQAVPCLRSAVSRFLYARCIQTMNTTAPAIRASVWRMPIAACRLSFASASEAVTSAPSMRRVSNRISSTSDTTAHSRKIRTVEVTASR